MGLVAIEQEDVLNEIGYRLSEMPGKGFREYVKLAWPIIEPATPLAWAWFHDAICDHLEAVSRGYINQLIINIPPRHAKSTLVAIMWPTWEWGPGGMPHTRWIFSSYAQTLSQRDSQRRRLLMATPWYQSGWSHVFTLGRQKWTADGQIKYQNSKMGYHLSTSVTGSNTGEGGDRIVADDPHNMKEIHSENQRAHVVQWWDEVMSTRINDQRKVAKLVIMQRGHEADLCGHLLAKGGYEHLNLQAEFDPKRRCFTKLNTGEAFFQDPRTEAGELLFPERFPRPVIERLKIDLGDAYHAQFLQDPTPAEGGILKRSWWRYWVPPGHELAGQPDENGREILVLPVKFDQVLNSWDLPFKEKEESSYVVGQAWGRYKALSYLIQQVRGHYDFIETQHHIRALRLAHKQKPNAIYIEDKANGPAIMTTLALELPGILPSDVDSSKEARAHAASPRLKAGNYVLPHPSLPGYEWVARWGGKESQPPLEYQPGGHLQTGSFLNELTMFPNAADDDQVDTFTQADRYLYLQEEFSDGHFVPGHDHGI